MFSALHAMRTDTQLLRDTEDLVPDWTQIPELGNREYCYKGCILLTSKKVTWNRAPSHIPWVLAGQETAYDGTSAMPQACRLAGRSADIHWLTNQDLSHLSVTKLHEIFKNLFLKLLLLPNFSFQWQRVSNIIRGWEQNKKAVGLIIS